MTRGLLALLTILFLELTSAPAFAGKKSSKEETSPQDGLAEARLIEIYRLTGAARPREALARAEKLVRDFPNFQLAQLVYGDLLVSRTRPIHNLGEVPTASSQTVTATLNELREESRMRLKAWRERPPVGTVPSHFLALSPRNKHAIAIDASRSRLYLFKNSHEGLHLMADYYISVGKSGVEKSSEGDSRTPLGIYFITSNLDPKTLRDFYGSGALPINYPNVLDSKRGKTGRGIWLHGTPSNQFSRAPQASDGCVILANPDLEHIINTVEVRTTPVVISQKLDWVPPHNVRSQGKSFEDTLTAWRQAKTNGDLNLLLSFYAADFNSHGKTLREWTLALRNEINRVKGRSIQLKDLSYLRWTDTTDTMVVTFGEVSDGNRSGPTKRQYWIREGARWKIFYEGNLG